MISHVDTSRMDPPVAAGFEELTVRLQQKLATMQATLDAVGGTALAVKITAIDYTAVASDRVINVTVTGKTVTLYNAAGNSGQWLAIDNSSGGNITVAAVGGNLIQGAATLVIATGVVVLIYCNGAGFRKLSAS